MPVDNEPALATFDAGAALSLARERAGDGVLAAAEFTADGFNLLYLADEVVEAYGGESEVWEAGKAIHGYVHLDFEERRLFGELYPTVEDTYAFVTHTDFGQIARVLTDDEGFYLTLRPGVPASELVEALAEVVRGSGQAGGQTT